MIFALKTDQYPRNILSDIFMSEIVDDYLGEDNIRGLEYVIYTLGRQHKALIQERYVEHLTFEEIADLHNVNVNKIKKDLSNTLFRIRTTELANYIIYGKNRYRYMCLHDKTIHSFEIPIEVLGLSARSENALRRAGYKWISEILDFEWSDFMFLNNLGTLSVAEITTTLENFKINNIVPTKVS